MGRNGVYNLFRLAITVPIFVALTPFMVQRLGEAAYGAWALVAATLAVTTLADLGITAAIVRYVAVDEARAGGELNTVVNTAAVLFLGIAATIFAIVWMAEPWLLRTFFKLPSELVPETRVLLLGSMAAFLLSFVASPFYAVLPGLQQYAASNLIAVLGISVSAIATVAVLLQGWNLAGLTLVPWAQTMVVAVGHVLALRQYVPALRVRPRDYQGGTARELVGFGTRAFVGQLGDFADLQMDKFILGHYLGSVEAGLFHVASTVARQLASIPLMLLSPLLPVISGLTVQQDHPGLVRTFHDAIRYSWSIGALFCAGVFVFAAPFMDAWLGASYSAGTLSAGVTLLRILAVALLLTILSAPYTYVLLAISEPGILARSASVALVLNVGLSLAWVERWGIQGVALATVISSLVGLVYVILSGHRRLGDPISGYMRLVGKPVIAAALTTAAAWWVLSEHLHAAWSLLGVCAGAITFSVVYAVVLVSVRFLHPDEVVALRRVLRLRA